MKIYLISILILCMYIPGEIKANYSSEELDKILNFYKRDDFYAALDLMEREPEGVSKSTIYFLRGLCYNRVQDFDEAIEAFNLARSFGASEKNIDYELGEAFFGNYDLKEARRYFLTSVQKNVLVANSIYYMGKISQDLEQYHVALKYYKKISRLKDKPIPILQGAMFNTANIVYDQVLKRPNPKKNILPIVIPKYKKAFKIASNSSMALEIQNKIREILDRYDLDPNKLKNGRQISAKKFNLSFVQSSEYDSNVISEAEETTAHAEYKDTVVLKSDFTTNYKFVIKRRILLTPELKLTYNYNATHRSLLEIRQNDQYTIVPKLGTSLEHRAFNQPASFIFDVDYNYTAKDNDADGNFGNFGKLVFSGRTYSFTIGEKLKFLSWGESTFKITRRIYKASAITSNSNTNGFSYSQNIDMGEMQMLLVFLGADFTENPNDISNSLNAYTIRFDYIYPNMFWGLLFGGAFSTTITDTRRQKKTRGIEKTLNPSVTFTKNLSSNFELALEYSYTKNLSKAKTTNQYNKHVVGLEFKAKI